MKKIFLIPMMAIMCAISAWGVQVVNINQATDAEREAALRAALAITTDSVEITLQNDITFNAVALLVEPGARVLLNLNGYGITSNYTCKGSCDMREDAVFRIQGLLHIVSNGKSIIQKPVGTANDAGTAGSAILAPDGGTVIIDGGIFLAGYVDAGLGFPCYVQLPVLWCYDGSTVVINGGTFLTTTYSPIMVSFGLIQQEYGTINYSISGGVFSKDVSSKLDAEKYIATSVSYKNANIVGYGKGGETKNVYVVRPVADAASIASATANNSVEINANEEVAENTTAAAKFIYIDPGKSLTIEKGAKLHVGEGGIVMGGTDSRLIVEAGATLLSEGDIVTSADENVQLTMDARYRDEENEIYGLYSVLALKANNIQAKHPNATVTLKSVNNYNGEYQWQRFAIPTYQTNLTRSIVQADPDDGHTYGTAIYRWDYNSSAENKWTSVADDYNLNPFECYNMTINTDEEANYIFKCELVGNGNPTIALHNDWNFLANSYTAPIQLGAVLKGLQSDADHILTSGVWVQLSPTAAEWASVTTADMIFDEMITKELKPMQAFVFHKSPESAHNTVEINYEKYVSEYLFGTSAQSAPARHQSVAEDITRAHIIVADENNVEETVKLYLSGDFSSANDDGFDLPKFINEDKFNFYAVTDLGNLERVASNSLDEIALVLKTKDATSFTLKFDKVSLEGYAIRDNLTEDVISITAENEYAFTAEANSTIADRFVVIKQQATAMDNTEAASAKKGIYSLTGVYMGENFHVLPAGIYIMNGKKVVK